MALGDPRGPGGGLLSRQVNPFGGYLGQLPGVAGNPAMTPQQNYANRYQSAVESARVQQMAEESRARAAADLGWANTPAGARNPTRPSMRGPTFADRAMGIASFLPGADTVNLAAKALTGERPSMLDIGAGVLDAVPGLGKLGALGLKGLGATMVTPAMAGLGKHAKSFEAMEDMMGGANKLSNQDRANLYGTFGIGRTPEGEMFSEISDAGMAFTPAGQAARSARGNQRMTLGEAVEHDALFSAMPEARDFGVQFSDMAAGRGSFDPNTGMMTINRAADDPLGVITHELGHGVQGRLGWASGTSPEAVRGAADPRTSYFDDAGEAMARAADARRSLEADALRDPANSLWTSSAYGYDRPESQMWGGKLGPAPGMQGAAVRGPSMSLAQGQARPGPGMAGLAGLGGLGAAGGLYGMARAAGGGFNPAGIGGAFTSANTGLLGGGGVGTDWGGYGGQATNDGGWSGGGYGDTGTASEAGGGGGYGFT